MQNKTDCSANFLPPELPKEGAFAPPPVPENSVACNPFVGNSLPSAPNKSNKRVKALAIIIPSTAIVLVAAIIVTVCLKNKNSNSRYGYSYSSSYYSGYYPNSYGYSFYSYGSETGSSSGYNSNNQYDDGNGHCAIGGDTGTESYGYEESYIDTTTQYESTYRESSSYKSSGTAKSSSKKVLPYSSDAIPKNLSVGDSLTFGNSSWLVLERQGNKAFICRFVIGNSYGDGSYYNKLGGATTWETCSLRKYLNSDFYNSFTMPERKRILTTKVVSDDNPDWDTDGGNDTEDKIYILSETEVKKYYSLVSELRDRYVHYHNTGLRTPGKSNDKIAYFSYEYTKDDGSYSFNNEGWNVNSSWSFMCCMWIKTD